MLNSLVVDLGGTYSRFAIIDQQYQIKNHHTFINYEFQSFADILKKYLELYPEACANTQQCGIAVAGPVKNNNARLTNINWTLNAEELYKDCNFKRIEIINDFYSLGYCIPLLKDECLIAIQNGKPDNNGIRVILGAGTGLGVAVIKQKNKKYEVLPSEGGHIDFAPTTERQINLLKFMQKKHKHVSAERLLSGRGIESLFEFICDEKQTNEFNSEKHISEAISGRKIIELANEKNPLAIETMEFFCEIYAAYIGNIAFMTLPYGGIYIAGGIAKHILKYLLQPNFLKTYANKGPLSHILNDIPIYYIANKHAGLLGAGYYLSAHNFELGTS